MARNDTLFHLADWLTSPPSGGPIQMWSVGGLLSVVTMYYGLACCVTERATTLNVTTRGFRPLGQGFWLEITGVQAVSFGILITSVGLFMHFQWFWGNHPRLVRYHEFGKYFAGLITIIAALAHIYTIIAWT